MSPDSAGEYADLCAALATVPSPHLDEVIEIAARLSATGASPVRTSASEENRSQTPGQHRAPAGPAQRDRPTGRPDF